MSMYMGLLRQKNWLQRKKQRNWMQEEIQHSKEESKEKGVNVERNWHTNCR
jgi:hypothetical protein